MPVTNEARIAGRIRVNANGENRQVGVIVVELEQGRQLLDARRALAPPEIQQNDFAPIAGQMNGCGSVGDGEIWRWLVCLGRMRASIAPAHHSKPGDSRR